MYFAQRFENLLKELRKPIKNKSNISFKIVDKSLKVHAKRKKRVAWNRGEKREGLRRIKKWALVAKLYKINYLLPHSPNSMMYRCWKASSVQIDIDIFVLIREEDRILGSMCLTSFIPQVFVKTIFLKGLKLLRHPRSCLWNVKMLARDSHVRFIIVL